MSPFEKIYRECFSDVYKYLCRLSGDALLAEELCSETFFRAMKSLDSFRGDCPERVWLFRIAKNCFFSHARKSGRELSPGPEAEEELPDRRPGPEEQALRRDEAARVRSALHSLPENYREVFMWRVYAELGFREIGELFGKSENWACVSYHRAVKMIRQRLEDEK